MSTATKTWMTTEEMLALPDDGVERELICGELRERPMTRRNRKHSRSTSRIAHLLEAWLEARPEPRGEVLAGEAGMRLARDPDTTVGIDVAYISPELARATPEGARFPDGVPILAVEILSPTDKHEETVEKLESYLSAGVPLVWIVDPDMRTVTVYRPGAEPELFNASQTLTAEPHLPGLRLPVTKVFKA